HPAARQGPLRLHRPARGRARLAGLDQGEDDATGAGPMSTPPPLTCTRSAHRIEDAGCLERLNRFARGHRLREMKFSGRNVNRMLRAGLGPEIARRLLGDCRARTYGLAEWRLESE